jgi:DNA polymerase-3 subunit delta'
MWQVIGQSRAASYLQHSLETGTLAHAYLLIGPPHVGKMTMALHLAQALNCDAEERPCRECPSCRKIAALNHADVQVIGLLQNGDDVEAKLISIDQIKDMQHTASLPPFEGKEKVFIIDGAELLSTDAANRLLKTLEEPVGGITFILLTTNEKLLPATVVSRCQCLEMPPLPGPEIAAALVERLDIDRERAALLAGLSHGCPGWAIAAAEDDSLVQKRNEELNDMLAVIDADSEQRFAYANRLANRFGQNREDVYQVLELWLDYWRDLMLVKMGCHDMITNIDRKEELIGTAARYDGNRIREFIGSIRSAGEQLRRNANPRLALEVLMLDIPGKEGGG